MDPYLRYKGWLRGLCRPVGSLACYHDEPGPRCSRFVGLIRVVARLVAR